MNDIGVLVAVGQLCYQAPHVIDDLSHDPQARQTHQAAH
jgi:hypothetical protein